VHHFLIECSFALQVRSGLNERMKVSLTVAVPGDMEGKQIPVSLAEFLIGRDPDCHVCPASPRVGKRHCAILLRNQKVFLKTFDTVSGTLVNDRRVDGEVQLLDGDWLKIGPLLFRLNIEAAPVHHEDLAATLLLQESQAAEAEADKDKASAELPNAQPPPKPPSRAAQEILAKYRRRGRG
jgi:predicted component of type VI protein secretion system